MNYRMIIAGLAVTTTFFVASAWAAPQISAPHPTVASQIVRTGAGNVENAQIRHHNRYDFHAQQQMHTGGGGNSK